MTITETTATATDLETRTAEVSGASLKACTFIAGHTNTKHRPTLRNVAIGAGLVVATDSYRCVVAAAEADCVPMTDLLDRVAAFDPSEAILLGADALKSAKLGSELAQVVDTAGVVELHQGGNVYRVDATATSTEYVKLQGIFPPARDLWPTSGHVSFDPDYLADMGKISKALASAVRARAARNVVRIQQADPLKPGLFWIGRTADAPSALYLLMPIRDEL